MTYSMYENDGGPWRNRVTLANKIMIRLSQTPISMQELTFQCRASKVQIYSAINGLRWGGFKINRSRAGYFVDPSGWAKFRQAADRVNAKLERIRNQRKAECNRERLARNRGAA